jgi:hypothetical protein
MADGTFTWTFTLLETAAFRQEDRCFLLQDSNAPDCAPLQDALNENPNFSSATCTYRELGCDCSLTSRHSADSVTGTWSTSTGALTLTASDNSVLAMNYCRQDTTLTLNLVPGETGSVYSLVSTP